MILKEIHFLIILELYPQRPMRQNVICFASKKNKCKNTLKEEILEIQSFKAKIIYYIYNRGLMHHKILKIADNRGETCFWKKIGIHVAEKWKIKWYLYLDLLLANNQPFLKQLFWFLSSPFRCWVFLLHWNLAWLICLERSEIKRYPDRGKAVSNLEKRQNS